MGGLSLYAIAIDELRDMFAATPELADTLRGVARQRFHPVRTPSRGLLGRLGPLFRQPADAPVIHPEDPGPMEVEALLAGRHVPPHRLDAAWRLLAAWLEQLGWATITVPVTNAGLAGLDFDLSSARVPADYGLQAVLKNPLGVSLRPPPGLAAGFVRTDHALGMRKAWRGALSELDPANQQLLRTVLVWLDGYPGWAEAAEAQHRPPPDLVAILRG